MFPLIFLPFAFGYKRYMCFFVCLFSGWELVQELFLLASKFTLVIMYFFSWFFFTALPRISFLYFCDLFARGSRHRYAELDPNPKRETHNGLLGKQNEPLVTPRSFCLRHELKLVTVYVHICNCSRTPTGYFA